MTFIVYAEGKKYTIGNAELADYCFESEHPDDTEAFLTFGKTDLMNLRLSSLLSISADMLHEETDSSMQQGISCSAQTIH